MVLLLLRFLPLLGGSRRVKMVVVEELCSGCGNCVVACPANALRAEIQGGKGGGEVIGVASGVALELDLSRCERVKNPDAEKPCRACMDACPSEALYFTSC
ncbi:MAG: 4Fe-4S dicluster domain-containing protein [Euryarchaeota archaeon]|nr:4Fe-4S dicluster domain-containing protein [Euryarchaeota archaeon]